MPTHKVVKRKMTKRKIVNEILSLRSRVHSFTQWKASMKNLTAMVQGEEYELPTMAISELDIGDVQSMLNLSFSLNNTDLRNQPVVDPFAIYTEWMEFTRDAFGNGKGNEALTRVTLNNLLVYAHRHATSRSDNLNNTIHINAEGHWRYGPVVHKGTKFDLIGRPDYSISYGISKDLTVSVVVVEAKSGTMATSGVA